MSNALDTLRAACEAQFPEDHDWPAALARVEAVIEAARVHLNTVKHPLSTPGAKQRAIDALAAALAALDEGEET